MKIILVTGTPGSGKTTTAKDIAKLLKFKYVDVNEVIEQYNLKEGFDFKRNCNVIDVDKLNKTLNEIIELNPRGVVIDSHLSHYYIKSDLCVVTKVDLKELKKRLEKRGYSKEKIRENLDVEIFDVCLNEAKELGHKVVIIDTSKDITNQLREKILSN